MIHYLVHIESIVEGKIVPAMFILPFMRARQNSAIYAPGTGQKLGGVAVCYGLVYGFVVIGMGWSGS